MARIQIDKIPAGKDWKRILFTKGIYTLLPSSENSIAMRAGHYTNAKTYINKGFILEITELEEWVEFKSNDTNAHFYRFNLNNLSDFILAVEEYKDDIEKFKIQVNTQMQPTIDGHTQELAAIENWQNGVDAKLKDFENRIKQLEARP